MKPWAKAAVSLGLLALLFALLPWDDVRDAFARVPASVWLVTLGGFVAGHQVGVFKWRLLMRACRAVVGVRDATRFYFAGLFANLCLPTIVGGDVLRAVLAGRRTGRLEAAFLAGIMDRLLDIATMALLIGGGALAAGRALPGIGGDLITILALVGAALGMVFAPLLLRRPLARWPRKLRRPVGRALVSLRHLAQRPSAAAGALAISVAVQSSFVLLNAGIGRAIGIEVPLAAWFMAWPLAKVAGLLPVSLGGLAVRDATFGALLVPLGVPMASGVVAALVWQSVMIAGGLTGLLVWYLLTPAEGRSVRGLVAVSRGSHA